MNKYLPSEAAMAAHQGTPRDDASHERRALLDRIAERYAINAISVYDWLTGFPAQYFDVAPLCEIAALSNEALCDGVHPYVGTLKEQYRLHPSLSAVPRALFYDNMALQDGKPAQAPECRFMFLQVDRAKNLAGEDNSKEADTICERLEIIQESRAAKDTHASVMIITPYRRQEALLRDRIDAMRGVLPNLCSIEVCTLDRCQGREADYVFISLVRSRATDFMDMPKRWNVALTRAKDALFIVGDVDAYRRETTRVPRTPVSLIAHIIEAYDAHAATYRRKQA